MAVYFIYRFFFNAGNYGNILPPNYSIGAKEKLFELQRQLKLVSESHQAEKKALALTYRNLSQDHGLAGREGKPLRSQLVQLAERYKRLLQLFAVQKDIGTKLERLEERVEACSREPGVCEHMHSDCTHLPTHLALYLPAINRMMEQN